MERPAESTEACKADVEADVGDASIGFAQQEHRAFNAPPLKVAVRRLAKSGAKCSDEMCFRDEGEPGERGNVEWIGVRAVHRVACAEHTAVGLHDGSTHRLINLTTCGSSAQDKELSSQIANLVRLAGIEPAAFRSGAERSVR